MVSLEISDLPCCAWIYYLFSRVTSLLGHVCFLEDVMQGPMAVRRFCIKTSSISPLHDKVIVVIKKILSMLLLCMKFLFGNLMLKEVYVWIKKYQIFRTNVST